jgi:hypothetical protein
MQDILREPVKHKCTECIHCETAHYQADKVCAPQRMGSSDPKSTKDNAACKYFEKAPLKRDRAGLYGVIIHEEWDSEEGHYVEKRPLPLY